jgi:uncharacterized RDD family membrane protein YckC
MSTELDKELELDFSKTTGNLLDLEDQLYLATKGQRFGNYIIDVIVFYALCLFFVFIIGPSTFDGFDGPGAELASRLISMLLFALMSGLFETIFKGKTIGKFFTGTRAVYTDGTQISAQTAFLRGFSKAVPFCAFSALGDPCHPWQDRWTDTYVIDEKRSRLSF